MTTPEPLALPCWLSIEMETTLGTTTPEVAAQSGDEGLACTTGADCAAPREPVEVVAVAVSVWVTAYVVPLARTAARTATETSSTTRRGCRSRSAPALVPAGGGGSAGFWGAAAGWDGPALCSPYQRGCVGCGSEAGGT